MEGGRVWTSSQGRVSRAWADMWMQEGLAHEEGQGLMGSAELRACSWVVGDESGKGE